MIDSGIYIITNILNSKVYVGSSKKIEVRWKWHKSALRNGRHHSKKLQSAFTKYGEENFKFSKIIICDHNNLEFYEERCIASFDAVENGYNICPIPNSVRGVKYSKESIEKSSNARRGAKRTPEMRERMAAAQLGKKRSAEAIAKFKETVTGRKNSPEAIQKMLATRKANGRTSAQIAHMDKLHRDRIGTKHSSEHIAKIAASNTGKKRTPEQIQRIREGFLAAKSKKKGA